MPATVELEPQHDARQYRHAVELLGTGELQAGARVLSELALNTADDSLHSRALFNLAEVLEQLGDVDKAYETWYALPTSRRTGATSSIMPHVSASWPCSKSTPCD